MKKSAFILLSFFLLGIISCQDKATKAELDTLRAELEELKAQQTKEEQNKELIRRYWNGKWNDRRPEILDELQTSDVIYHGPNMRMNGLKEYKQAYEGYRSALHDSKVELMHLAADGDYVISYIKLSSVHKGELAGLPPTGKQIETKAFTLFRLKDGKIVEEWEILDELGMMHQLGMELKMTE